MKWTMQKSVVTADQAGVGDRNRTKKTSRRMPWFLPIVVIALALNPLLASAGIIDNFEDGDTTNNPFWNVSNPAGNHVVASDPLRANNLVLHIHGTGQAHRRLSLFGDVIDNPWSGFDFSVEYSVDPLVPSWDFFYTLAGGGYVLRDRILNTNDPSNSKVLFNYASTDPLADVSIPGETPLDEWWRMHVWHDPLANAITSEVRRISDGQLMAANSFTPSVDLSALQIGFLSLEVESTNTQYIDNISLGVVPEPSTALLFGLATGFAFLQRKRK